MQSVARNHTHNLLSAAAHSVSLRFIDTQDLPQHKRGFSQELHSKSINYSLTQTPNIESSPLPYVPTHSKCISYGRPYLDLDGPSERRKRK
jgi:hypothetical protein